jgi:hypothetical protein
VRWHDHINADGQELLRLHVENRRAERAACAVFHIEPGEADG